MSKPDSVETFKGRDAKLIHAGEWTDCRLAELTPRQILVDLEVSLAIGAQVVACIAEVGAFPGTVESAAEGRCTILFKRSAGLSGEQLTAAYKRLKH